MSGRWAVGHKGFLIAIALAVSAQAWSGSKSDEFLIVERPGRLVVLNRYQQNLSSAEQTVLQPFVPMKILKRRDLLGDGFTPCTQVELGFATYFLVRESTGRLAGEAQAGSLTTYLGSSHPCDTVYILTNDGVRFSAAGGKRAVFLAAGEQVIRIFAHGGMTYVRRLGGTSVYGWASLIPEAEGRQWSVARLVPKTESAVPIRIEDSVQAALSRANELLVNLFVHFNKHSQQHRVTPRWRMESEGTVLRCILLDGSPESDFPESTRYLVREIENHVLGSGFGAVQVPGGIEIRPR